MDKQFGLSLNPYSNLTLILIRNAETAGKTAPDAKQEMRTAAIICAWLWETRFEAGHAIVHRGVVVFERLDALIELGV